MMIIKMNKSSRIKYMFMTLVIICVCCVSFSSFSEHAKYGAEIRFQDVDWGQSDHAVVDALVAKGLIDKYYFTGSGNKPCFCWPENDIDLQIATNNKVIPEIIRENNWKGTWQLQYQCKKLIGGYDPDALFIHFVGNIGKSSIADKCDNFIAVSIEYKEKSTEIPIPDMFIDLLSKLSEQYGNFDVYIDANLENDYFLKQNYGTMTAKELSAKIESYAASTNIMPFDKHNALAFAVIHGKNNTGITLRLLRFDELELIYGKTDTYLYFQKIEEILKEKYNKKQDAGL